VLVSTEEIAKFRYENLETRPAIAVMGIYLKTSGPGFFDADLALTRYCQYFIAIKGVVGKIYCAIL